jgi:hypothetical protein
MADFDDEQQANMAQQPIDPYAALNAPPQPATFRQRFAANPLGQFAVMRQSTNIEDDRGRSTAGKVAEQGLINLKQNIEGSAQALSRPFGGSGAPLPDTTADPLAAQLGYNSIPVQKVIHPSWWRR